METTYLAPSELRTIFRSDVEEFLRFWVAPNEPHYDQTLSFALGRLDEGEQVGAFLLSLWDGGRRRVLDLGAGNGGVSLGLANRREIDVVAVDVVINDELERLRRKTRLPIAQVAGDGCNLPFADETFDAVLCLETIEHVPDARALAREIMRILKPGGYCMVTTPARIRYWFQPDPHFGIRGLLTLPDFLQKFVAVHVLRRTRRYDVVHIFWHAKRLAALFPGVEKLDVFWNNPYPGGPLTKRLWSWGRYFLWDRIFLRKSVSGREV